MGTLLFNNYGLYKHGIHRPTLMYFIIFNFPKIHNLQLFQHLRLQALSLVESYLCDCPAR